MTMKIKLTNEGPSPPVTAKEQPPEVATDTD